MDADVTGNRQGLDVIESRELIEYFLDQFMGTSAFPGDCRRAASPLP